MLSLRNALLEVKTQNSEVLMLGLRTSEKGIMQAPTEGVREEGRKGGRGWGRVGGREGHQMSLAVDFPQVQVVINIGQTVTLLLIFIFLFH